MNQTLTSEMIMSAIQKVGSDRFKDGVQDLQAVYARSGAKEFARTIRGGDVGALLGISPEDWELIASQEDLANALFNLGSALWETDGHEESGLQILRKAAAEGSDEAAVALAEALLWLGENPEAEAVLRRAVDARGREWKRAAGLLGAVLSKQNVNDPGEAIGLMMDAGGEAGERVDVELAHALIKAGRHGEARDRLRILTNGGSSLAPIVLGNLLETHFDDPHGAEQAYRLGIERDDAYSAYNLALLVSRLGRRAEARHLLEFAADHGDSSAAEALELAEWREDRSAK